MCLGGVSWMMSVRLEGERRCRVCISRKRSEPADPRQRCSLCRQLSLRSILLSLMAIDYEQLAEDARVDLAQPVERLRGVVQLWTMFKKAYEVGKELRDRHGDLSVWSKHALSSMMVVDYTKPWSRNLEPSVRNLDKSFLSDIESRPLHHQLKEYRNQAAAHLDTGAQPDGVAFIGGEAVNGRPAPDEFDRIFVPGRVRIDVAMTLGLSDPAEIAAIVQHIETAMSLTQQEVSKAAAALRDRALKHGAVLDRIPGVVKTDAVLPDDAGKRQMPQHGMSRSPVTSRRTVTIGGRTFLEVVTVWETTPNMEFDEVGNGLRIQSSIGASGTEADFTVTFLKVKPTTDQ